MPTTYLNPLRPLHIERNTFRIRLPNPALCQIRRQTPLGQVPYVSACQTDLGDVMVVAAIGDGWEPNVDDCGADVPFAEPDLDGSRSGGFGWDVLYEVVSVSCGHCVVSVLG